MRTIDTINAEIKALQNELTILLNPVTLEDGEFYRHCNGTIVLKLQGTTGVRVNGYAWDTSSSWSFQTKPEDWTKLSPDRILSLLTAEAIKRGFVLGAEFKQIGQYRNVYVGSVESDLYFCHNKFSKYSLHAGNGLIFQAKTGTWAEIIQPKSPETYTNPTNSGVIIYENVSAKVIDKIKQLITNIEGQ